MIQTRVLSSVEQCLLFVISPITNADMVMFMRLDAMQYVKWQYGLVSQTGLRLSQD